MTGLSTALLMLVWSVAAAASSDNTFLTPEDGSSSLISTASIVVLPVVTQVDVKPDAKAYTDAADSHPYVARRLEKEIQGQLEQRHHTSLPAGADVLADWDMQAEQEMRSISDAILAKYYTKTHRRKSRGKSDEFHFSVSSLTRDPVPAEGSLYLWSHFYWNKSKKSNYMEIAVIRPQDGRVLLYALVPNDLAWVLHGNSDLPRRSTLIRLTEHLFAGFPAAQAR